VTVSSNGTPTVIAGITGSASISVTGQWPTNPTAPAAGDLLVAVIGGYGTTSCTVPTAPSGWTLWNWCYGITAGTGARSLTTVTAYYIKNSTGSDTVPTFSATTAGTAADNGLRCVIYDLSDSGGSTPVLWTDGITALPVAGTATVFTGPVPAGSLGIASATISQGTTAATNTWTTPSGFTAATGNETASLRSQFGSFYTSSAPTTGNGMSVAIVHSRTSTEQPAIALVAAPPSSSGVRRFQASPYQAPTTAAAVLTSHTFAAQPDELIVASAGVGNGVGTAPTSLVAVDNTSATLTALVTELAGADFGLAGVFAEDAGATPAVTSVTVTAAPSTVHDPCLVVYRFAGAAVTADQTGTTAHGTTATLSITPAQTGSVIVGASGDDGSTALTPNASSLGYTSTTGGAGDRINAYMGLAYTTASSAVTVGWSTAPTALGNAAAEIIPAPPAANPAPLYPLRRPVRAQALPRRGGRVYRSGLPNRILTNNFEGGSSGTTITTTNSNGISGAAFDVVSIGTSATLAFDNTEAAHGLLSMKVATGGTSTTSLAEWTFSEGPQLTIYFRLYLFLSATPTAAISPFMVRSGASVAASLLLTTPGTLQLRDGTNTTQVTFTTHPPTGSWYRIEGYVTGASGTGGAISASLYSPLDSLTPVETHTVTGINTTGAISAYWFGQANTVASSGPFWIDDIGISPVGFLGPAAFPPVTSGPPLTALDGPVRAPVPARRKGGIARAMSPLAISYAGPPLTALASPVQGRRRPTPRGRVYGISRPAVTVAPPTPAPLYPLSKPVRAVIPARTRGGRVYQTTAPTVPAIQTGAAPWYLFPTFPQWTVLESSTGLLPAVAIMNNGNGDVVWDSTWGALATALHAKGIKLLGYVYTQFGTRPEGDVETAIGNYLQPGFTPGLDTVDGIFFDQFNNLTGSESYYNDLCISVKSQFEAVGSGANSPLIWGNPGTAIAASYLTLPIDVFVTFEGPITAYQNFTPFNVNASGFISGAGQWPRQRFAHIVFEVVRDQVDGVVDRAWLNYAGWVYTTNGPGDTNPYAFIPGNDYLNDLVARGASEPPLLPQGIPPWIYPQTSPVSAPKQRPARGGRVYSRSGSHGGLGPALTALRGPVAAARRKLPPRGRVYSARGTFSGSGPVLKALAKPLAAALRILPPQGRALSRRGLLSGTGAVLKALSAPVRARPKLPPRGQVTSRAGIPFTGFGPPLTLLRSPVKAAPKLPPRGRSAANTGTFGGQGAAVYPIHQPVSVHHPLPPRGRVYSNPGGPVVAPPPPGFGPALTPLHMPVRASWPKQVSGGTGHGLRGTRNGVGPALYPLHLPVKAAPKLPPRGRVYLLPVRAVQSPAAPPLHVPVRAAWPQRISGGTAHGLRGFRGGAGPALVPLRTPVKAVPKLPPRGRIFQFLTRAFQSPPVPPLHAPVRAAPHKAPARGRIITSAVRLVPFIPTSGPALTPLRMPVRARPKLPPRGWCYTTPPYVAPGPPSGHATGWSVGTPQSAWITGLLQGAWESGLPASPIAWNPSGPQAAWQSGPLTSAWENVSPMTGG
jgi:hypothetical protein